MPCGRFSESRSPALSGLASDNLPLLANGRGATAGHGFPLCDLPRSGEGFSRFERGPGQALPVEVLAGARCLDGLGEAIQGVAVGGLYTDLTRAGVRQPHLSALVRRRRTRMSRGSDRPALRGAIT